MWNQPPGQLSVNISTSYKVDFAYSFQELSDFAENGRIIFHMKLMESVIFPNETIVSLDGISIPVIKILNNKANIVYTFNKDVNKANVQLTMIIVPPY